MTLPEPQQQQTNLIIIYLSPCVEIPKHTSLELLLELDAIIIGDVNRRHISWGNTLTNRRGRVLHDLTDARQLWSTIRIPHLDTTTTVGAPQL